MVTIDRDYWRGPESRVLEIDLGESVQRGSWGEVYKVRDGNGGFVAIKIARRDEVPFVTRGLVAEEMLAREVAVGLRQREVGLSPVLGLARVVQKEGEVVFGRGVDEDGELAVVMPWFNPRTSGLLAVIHDRDLVCSPRAQLAIMTNVMNRIKAMQEPVGIDQMYKYGGVAGVGNLIIDWRMQNRAGDETYPFHEQAREINEEVFRGLQSLSSLIEKRLGEGKFGAQHGDPRPENIVVVHEGDNWEAAEAPILDAVRLAMVTPDHPEGRVMEEWYMTDIMLQAGTALGTFFGMRGYKDWFKVGLEAYERVVEPIQGNRDLERLFGIALVYGLSIEAHVLGYRWDALLRRWQGLVAERDWKFGDWPTQGLPEGFYTDMDQVSEYMEALKELGDYSFPSRKEKMGRYWSAMAQLARSNFLGWKEALG